jgi:hypothetical protein
MVPRVVINQTTVNYNWANYLALSIFACRIIGTTCGRTA